MANAYIGNKTFDITTPVIDTRTLSFNNDAGDWIFAETMLDATNTYAGATYNGVAMTKIDEQITTLTNERWAFWALQNPTNGTNNLVVTMDSAPFNPLSINIFTAKDCGGHGTPVFDQEAVSPNSNTVTVEEGSLIYGGAVAGANSGKVIEIPSGTPRTIEFTHNVYNFHYGAWSATGLTAGSKTVSVENTATVAGYYLEIKGKADSTNKMFFVC